jgi:hypothetical protein
MQWIYCRHCMIFSGRDGLHMSRVALDMLSEHSTWSDLSIEGGFTKLWSQNPRGRGHLCALGTGRGIILKWIWMEFWGCGLNSGDSGKRPVAACFVHGYAPSYAVKRGKYLTRWADTSGSIVSEIIDWRKFFFNWHNCWTFHFKLSFNTFLFSVNLFVP